jgi:hypothetical protein
MKEKGRVLWFLVGTHRFLNISAITAPTMATAMITPIPVPITMVSVIGAGGGVGPGVAEGASVTPKAVSADEL